MYLNSRTDAHRGVHSMHQTRCVELFTHPSCNKWVGSLLSTFEDCVNLRCQIGSGLGTHCPDDVMHMVDPVA